MTKILRAKNKQRNKSGKTFLLIIAIIVNSVGLFFVVRWYSQFTDNQRPLTDIDEAAFKVFTNRASDAKPLSPDQRRLLQTNLPKQTIEEFLSLNLLSNPKFRDLRLNYEPPEVPTTTEQIDDLSGLVIGNSRPFRY